MRVGIYGGNQPPPNILFIVTDQQRFDTIRSLSASAPHTPNIDRLTERGTAFINAYSLTPVCVPARYTMYSGLAATKTGIFANDVPSGAHTDIASKFGPYLPTKMRERGYRTFGIGKFHTSPWDASLGFDTHLYSEEFYLDATQRARDSYAAWIAVEHPEFDWIEALMGERVEMYYMPQMSPLPASLTVESWATDAALREMDTAGDEPWFGFVSYIGPHPPFAPPIPYNRMYDPDRLSLPRSSDKAVDFVDQQIPWMNYAVYAEEVDGFRARALKARYYGEISYIDSCIGRLLDKIESGPNGDNTLICFFSDHGDLLGDHNGWQKENYFEAATRVPLLLSWPRRIPAAAVNRSFVCLEDLFGVATGASGNLESRDGIDLLAVAQNSAADGRQHLIGVYGQPGTDHFKAMVRFRDYKLIWMANGGQVQLFDLASDPGELAPMETQQELKSRLLEVLADHLRREGVEAALDGKQLRCFPYAEWEKMRIQQFDRSRGISSFSLRSMSI